jgi:TetR/AcrR family transcriptional repressor of nem operon
MRVSREKAAANRQRIIDAAGALFRAKGFAGIGVADIMRAADLTHGGFYRHFASKDDLAAQASRRTLARSAAKWERVAAGSPKGAYAALLANFLTPTHRDDPARGCAFASLGSDAARCGKAVRGAFGDGLRPLHSCRGRSGGLEGGAPAQSRLIRLERTLARLAMKLKKRYPMRLA